MRKGRFGIFAVAGLLLLLVRADGAAAQELEVSGNVSIASDYTFRGISQTLEEPAIQGGFDVSGPAGVYVGAWGSSVNFGEDLALGPRAQMELDLYAGIAPTLAGFDLDLGAIYYMYPGAASDLSYDFLEVGLGVSREFGPLGSGVTLAYSPDFFAGSGSSLFAGLEASAGIPGTRVSLGLGVGRQTIEDNDAFGTPDYTTWSVGATTDLLGATFGATVVGTDLGANDCFGGSDLCRSRVIVSVSRGL
jgi:uncharacterized protein (TIGR02001 family)